MSDLKQNTVDEAWRSALKRPLRPSEKSNRRPRPGAGRHRPEIVRDDPWLRALTGPPITAVATDSKTAERKR